MLYEVWLDAIGGQATLDETDPQIATVMMSTGGRGNSVESWRDCVLRQSMRGYAGVRMKC